MNEKSWKNQYEDNKMMTKYGNGSKNEWTILHNQDKDNKPKIKYEVGSKKWMKNLERIMVKKINGREIWKWIHKWIKILQNNQNEEK